MGNALTIYQQMNDLQTAATALHSSGFFSDVKTQAQAMVKVMAGAEIGLPPFASMTGIHIVQGKPVIGANLIATLVKNDPRYDYRVARADSASCILEWYENGKHVGQSIFSMDEAQAAGLTGKDNWRKYPSDMLFARALTRGARRYAPGIFGGAPVYTPDEMGVDTDEDGVIIPGEIITVTQPQPAAQTAGPGPMPDDELTIREAPAGDFLNIAAAMLDSSAEVLKIRLKELGYTSVPGDKSKRLEAYRQLKAAQPAPAAGTQDAQPALAIENTDAAEAARATAAGEFD